MSCQNEPIKVSNMTQLNESIKKSKPGDIIVMANGVWENAQILFAGQGTTDKPIILRAETPGKVSLEGQSFIKLGGEFLIVDGLYFRNGFTPSNSIIDFKITDENLANHCKVINCVIENFTQPNRYIADHWVEFWGRNNQLEHCYLAGKSNQGPTIRIYLKGNENIRTYHRITKNHFGPRPRKGGPRAETMQIGASNTSMTPSFVMVSNNFFERCNGEVEVISSKSNFNEFKNNVFYECEGSLVLRHGNYCKIDGNFFIGSETSDFTGGIRVINTGHWITNNYFYMIRGEEFRAPLAIMNGIPKSPLNRYNQVTDVVVAHNSWIDCRSPWQLSVGANMSKKDVLPEREIRSARPVRTLIANNIIFNRQPDDTPIKIYDKVDGITFKNNLIDNQNSGSFKYDGITTKSLKLEGVTDWLYVVADSSLNDISSSYFGFGFEDIRTDIFGNSRADKSNLGAINKPITAIGFVLDKSNYGAEWYPGGNTPVLAKKISEVSSTDELIRMISKSGPGEIIELDSGIYNLNHSLDIKNRIVLRSKNEDGNVSIIYNGAQNTPLFRMNPGGRLFLDNVDLKGMGEQYTIAPLEKDMSSSYNLNIKNSKIQHFRNILKAYRGSFADTISFSNTQILNCLNGIELAAETDDRGDYNAEFVYVNNCSFENIGQNVINYYRGGYDESTIGGNLLVQNSLFNRCARLEKSKILLKTRGIINVSILENTFENNPVNYIAILWGEKNNYHEGNKITGSGAIRVDQYLKQKLVY